MSIKVIFFLFLLAFNLIMLFSQQDTLQIDEIRNKSIKIFIECQICDLDYLREKIQYVNYVRIQQNADVNIFSTSQQTASKGNEYTFFFIGQNSFAGINDTLRLITNISETEEIVREKITQIIQIGLTKYVAKTELMKYLQVTLNLPNVRQKLDDPWKSWFFRLSTNLYANGEKRYQSLSSWSSFSTNKITPDWKYEFNFSNNYNSSIYEINDTLSIKSSNLSYGFNNVIVKSLGEHWSIGENFNISSSEYRNIKINIHLKPSIEFNFFPFSEATRRQLRFLYGVGVSQFYYNDTTIYLKTEELLYLQSLNIAYEQIEPWGSAYISVRWSNYLHNFDLNNLNLFSQINWRIYKGLSINLSGGVSLVHDQINLPKKGVSYEEILTKQRQLESQYNYWVSGGFSFSFGSIFNNVVNPRFNL